MNVISRPFQAVPARFRVAVKRSLTFLLGTVLTVFYAQLVHAQGTANTPVRSAYSPATIGAGIVAAILTILFLRGMYLVLTYASETYGLDDPSEHGSTASENDPLLFGAIAWIVGSSLIIAAYGWAWQFLFLGPIICLLGPIVPIVAMNIDIQKYKTLLAEQVLRRSYTGRESEF